MTANLLTQAVIYTFNTNQRNGTVSSGLSLPDSAIIVSSRTVCLSAMTGTGTISVGTSFATNLFLDALAVSALSTTGSSTDENAQTRLMDDTNNIIITFSGTITAGSFITFITYYYPIQELPNVPFVPTPPPPTPSLMTVKSDISNVVAPASALTFVNLFQVSGFVTIRSFFGINKSITTAPATLGSTGIYATNPTTPGTDSGLVSTTANGVALVPNHIVVLLSTAPVYINEGSPGLGMLPGNNPNSLIHIPLSIQISDGSDTFIAMRYLNNDVLIDYNADYDFYVTYEPSPAGGTIVSA